MPSSHMSFLHYIVKMEIYKVLDMKTSEGEDRYLIHWLGKHRDSSTWHSRTEILRLYPQQLPRLEDYDNNFRLKCSQVKKDYSKQIKRSVGRPKRIQKQPSNDPPQEKLTSATGAQRRRKGRMVLRQGSDQTVIKAKQMMHTEQANSSFPSDKLKITIFTQTKFQSHWAYNDSVQEIIAKKPEGTVYSVLWSDGKEGEVEQRDLIERESTKLCQYWQSKLGLLASKKQPMHHEEK